MRHGMKWSVIAAFVASLAVNACDCGGETTSGLDATSPRRDTGVTPFDAGQHDVVGADLQSPDSGSPDHASVTDAQNADSTSSDDAAIVECTDDALEENDAVEQATQMAPGSISGQICPDDLDWFAVNIGANQQIVAHLTFVNDDGDLDLKLYDSLGGVLETSASSSDDEEVSHIATTSDTYYIRINGYDGAMAAYSLTVTVDDVVSEDGGVQPPACSDDAMEDNDTLASASPVTAGDHQAQLCPGDPDFFKVNLNVGDSLSADLAIDSVSANLDLQLLAPDGTEVGASTTLTQTEHVETTATVAGAYVLRVFGATVDDSSLYTLSVALQQVTPVCSDDGFENNDDADHAVDLAPGEHDAIICAGDDDWYALSLQAGDDLLLDLLFSDADGDLNMDLLGPAGQVLVSADSTDDNEQIHQVVAVGGIYKLRVFGVDSAANDYSLHVVVTPPANACQNDAFEPNDSAVQASPLGQGDYSGKICAGDEDWYRVTLNNGDSLDANLNFTNADGNLDLKIFSADGQTLLDSSLSDDDNEQLSIVAALSGDVLVQVLGRSAVENTYNLVLTLTPAVVTCQDDGFEDNDTQASAVDLQAGQFSAAICPDDADWYHLALNAGDSLSIGVLYTYNDGDINASLLDAAGQTVVAGVSADDDEQLNADITVAGDYYLVVSGAAGVSNSYSLDIEVTASQTCRDDGFEDNDSAANALLLVAGDYDASICSGDDDFYAVDLNAGDTIDASIDFNVNDGDLDIALLSEAGAILTSSTTATSGQEAIHYVVASAGRYKLRVYGFAGAAADYSLSLSIVEAVPVCREDAYEENDSQASATLVEAGTLNGQICSSDDDWFAIALNAHDVLDIDLLFSDADGDLDLALFKPDATVAQGSSSTDDNEAIHAYEAPEAGVYAIRVRGFMGASNAYQLVLGLTAYVPPCPEDNFEENDSTATATVYSGASMAAQICPDDDDYFSIQLNAGDTLDVSMLFTDADGDLDMMLLSSDGSTVASAMSVSDNETIADYLVPQAGVYYLDVYGINSAKNAYTLSMSVTPVVPVCDDDPYEDNDQRWSATPYAGNDIVGQICAADADWYSFDMNAGDSLRAELLFSQSVGDLDMWLYDANDQLLESAGTITDNELITFSATDAGTYYLKVNGFNDSESPYHLNVTLTTPTPTCVDDGNEDNDSPETAVALSGDVDGQICSGDDDYYSVDLSAGQTFVASLGFVNADGDLDMQLINPQGAIVASARTASDDEQLSYAARLAGTFILRIYGYRGAENSYSLSHSVNAELSCPGDDALEPNDDFAHASTALTGTVVGILCTGDDDYYKIDVPEGGLLRAELSFDGDLADLDLYIYAANEDELDSSMSVSSRETVAAYSDTATSYYVRVHGYQNGEEGNYALKLGIEQSPFYAPGSPKGCPADDGLDNDGLTKSVQMRNGDTSDGVICGGKMDWYAVSIEEGEVLNANLAFADVVGDLGLALLDPQGEMVIDQDGASDNENITYTVPAAAAGTYFLAVYGVSDVENWYSLSIGQSGQNAVCVEDDHENNDDIASSTTIIPGHSMGGQYCADDEDYYKVTIGAGQTLTATLMFAHGEKCDLDLDLYDEAEENVDYSYGSTDREVVTATADSLASEYTYYFDVLSVGENHACPYTIDVQVEGP